MPDQYQTVQVPGEGNVQFPVSMSDADISKALQSHFAQKAGTDPATLKSYARQWYGGDIQKASVAYAKASQGGQEPGIGDTLKQGLENAKAFGQGVVDLGKGAWQQAKDIINPPPAAEAKYNAQHALDSVDPDVLLNWIKDKYDKGGLSPQDQKDLFRGMGTLGAQALVAKAADTAVQKPEAVSSAVDTAKTGLANAADVTGTAIKGAAEQVKEAHTGKGAVVPIVSAAASAVPVAGHALGAAIEVPYTLYHSIKGASAALDARSVAKATQALQELHDAAAIDLANRLVEQGRQNPTAPATPSAPATTYQSNPLNDPEFMKSVEEASQRGKAKAAAAAAQNQPNWAEYFDNLNRSNGGTATPPAPQPPVEPIASDLPSGKRVPTAEERVARASTEIAQPSPPATPDTALLDSVAKGQTGKLFKNLTGPQQEIVKKLAAQVAEPSASPAQAPPPPGTVMVKPSQVQGAGENAPAFDGKWDAEDLARINNYRQMIEKGQPFREDPTDPNSPVAPIRLYKQPDGSLTTQDGFHRLAAAQQAGDAPLPAQIEDVKPPAAKAQTPAEIIAEKKAAQSRATETTPAETIAAKKQASQEPTINPEHVTKIKEALDAAGASAKDLEEPQYANFIKKSLGIDQPTLDAIQDHLAESEIHAKDATPVGRRGPSPSGQQGGTNSEPEVRNRSSVTDKGANLLEKKGWTAADLKDDAEWEKAKNLIQENGPSVSNATGGKSGKGPTAEDYRPSDDTRDALIARMEENQRLGKAAPSQFKAKQYAAVDADLETQLKASLAARGTAETVKTPQANAKTKLDLLLDAVKPGQREITFDLEGYTPEQISKVERAAKNRGLDAAFDGRHMLVRDLRNLHKP